MVLEKLLCPSRSLWRRAWQDCVSQYNIRPARPRPRPIFLVSDWPCPKTDGLRPHHWLSSSASLQKHSSVINMSPLSDAGRITALLWRRCQIVCEFSAGWQLTRGALKKLRNNHSASNDNLSRTTKTQNTYQRKVTIHRNGP